MKKLIFALTTVCALGAFCAPADALPASGPATIKPLVHIDRAIEKTAVVVVKKRPRRVCRTIVTAHRRVTRCN